MWDPQADPGPMPPELRGEPVPERWLEVVDTKSGWDALEAVAEWRPEFAAEIEAVRQGGEPLDAPAMEAWLEGLAERLSDTDEYEDEPEDTVPHDCVCGREDFVPFAPGTRGVFTCDSCGQRWGVETFPEGGGAIWGVD